MKNQGQTRPDAAPGPLEAVAERIEARSPGLAARLREIASARAALPYELSSAYARAIERALGFEGASGEATRALARLAGAELEAIGAGALETWSEAVAAIAAESPRAASAFAEGALAALARSRARTERSIRRAAQAVAALARRHGSSPLLPRFAERAGAALGDHGAAVIEAWAELCARTRFGGRRPADVLGPDVLPPWQEGRGLAEEETAALVRVAAVVAERDLARAPLALRLGPEVARHLPPEVRALAIALLLDLARVPAACLDALETLGPVLRRIPPSDRPAALDAVAAVARELPAAAAPFLRRVLRVGEALGFERGLADFVRHGLALAESSPDTARAFLGLESRGARAFLERGGSAVSFEEVEHVLRGYLRLIAPGAPSPEGVEAAGLLPAIGLAPEATPVASRAALFPTWEENFTLLKLQATLGSLWAEAGTFDFDLHAWEEAEAARGNRSTGPGRGRESSAAPPSGAPPSGFGARTAPSTVRPPTDTRRASATAGEPSEPVGLAGLYCRFRSPELAAGLLAHLEALRLAPVWTRRYPGLAADVSALRRRLFGDDAVPAALGAPGAILFLALGGSADAVDWAWPGAATLRAFAERAQRLEATVYDSADELGRLAERLEAGELVRLVRLEEMLEEDPMLAYLLDEADERPGGPEPGGEPAAPEREGRGSGRRVDERSEGGRADPEVLRAYLEQHPEVAVLRSDGPLDPTGLFVAGLTGGGAASEERRRRSTGSDPVVLAGRARPAAAQVFVHDEWDYRIADYRPRWCRVHVIAVEGDDASFFRGTLARYAELLPEIRRHFQRVRPEGYRIARQLLDGEDFDLNALVDARADLRARRDPSQKLYCARQREERDVATLFLLDMSASTDEAAEPAPAIPAAAKHLAPPPRARRIIDVQKEALVIMAQALEEIGDRYAIQGFSGHGRDRVETFEVKSFAEPLSLTVQARIGAIEPQRSTRMGAAIRQAVAELSRQPSRSRHLILLSDGFPQDFDYGDDRRSNVYGLRDTAMALREARRAGIATFCITVDRAGNDYLREMCDERSYLVIDDIHDLPLELPKIYSEATRDA